MAFYDGYDPTLAGGRGGYALGSFQGGPDPNAGRDAIAQSMLAQRGMGGGGGFDIARGPDQNFGGGMPTPGQGGVGGYALGTFQGGPDPNAWMYGGGGQGVGGAQAGDASSVDIGALFGNSTPSFNEGQPSPGMPGGAMTTSNASMTTGDPFGSSFEPGQAATNAAVTSPSAPGFTGGGFTAAGIPSSGDFTGSAFNTGGNAFSPTGWGGMTPSLGDQPGGGLPATAGFPAAPASTFADRWGGFPSDVPGAPPGGGRTAAQAQQDFQTGRDQAPGGPSPTGPGQGAAGFGSGQGGYDFGSGYSDPGGFGGFGGWGGFDAAGNSGFGGFSSGDFGSSGVG